MAKKRPAGIGRFVVWLTDGAVWRRMCVCMYESGRGSVVVGVSDMKNAQKIKHALRHFGLGSSRGICGVGSVKLADRSWELEK